MQREEQRQNKQVQMSRRKHFCVEPFTAESREKRKEREMERGCGGKVQRERWVAKELKKHVRGAKKWRVNDNWKVAHEGKEDEEEEPAVATVKKKINVKLSRAREQERGRRREGKQRSSRRKAAKEVGESAHSKLDRKEEQRWVKTKEDEGKQGETRQATTQKRVRIHHSVRAEAGQQRRGGGD